MALQRLPLPVSAPRAQRQRPEQKEKDTEKSLPITPRSSLLKKGETLAKLKFNARLVYEKPGKSARRTRGQDPG